MDEKGSLVRLNVGGQWFTTTKSTLTSQSDSLFTKMLEKGPKQPGNNKNEGGFYFIDRDGELFKHILNFLRSSELNLPSDFTDRSQLLTEAKFYRLQKLVQKLESGGHGKEGEISFIEVVETAHPEKVGVCSSRIVLTEEMREEAPFADIIEQLPAGHDEYHGAVGRFWVRTNMSRLDWAQLLTAHGWKIASTTCFCRRLPDITGQGTDLCHMVEKWYKT